MRCSSCGHDNEAGRKFCGRCGTRLAFLCPSCGHAVPPEDRFCGECGTPVSAPELPPANFETAAPESERRLVTVLFADLVGFTAASEARDPEDVREFLSRYFETAREIVGRYGGTVEKFIGDAVMAVWGAPVANEDDAERAVRAALDLVEAVPALTVGSVGGLALRAGVLTGEAAVNLAAQGQGMVAGDLVNTASRLQAAAGPGQVLVGEGTWQAASEAIAFEPAGDQVVKGKALPVPAWRAMRVVARRRGVGRAAGVEPPFVGRDHELQLLKDLYHATVRESRARLVSVTGIAGIGKSRLAAELEKHLDGLVENIWWHQGRSPSYGEGVTFWALGEMVRRRAGVAEVDDEAATRLKVAETLDRFVPDAEERRWVAPALYALLGLEDAPAGKREELFAAWRTFFERVADQGSTVMVFEDLHWADAGLIDFIESILEWSRGRPILVVTLARPELLDRRPTWGAGQRHFTAVHLEPLPDEAMTALVAGMAPGLPDLVVRRIVEQADGVPLYAVETFRMLVDSGRLEAVEGGYRPSGSLERLEIPATLQALVGARLDALDPADRALVQDASVLGKTFTLAGLAGISGQPAADLEERLHGLMRRDLLVLDVDPRSPERGQYGFVQSVIREVAYGTLARRDRRARHLAAARFYETLDDPELAGILASHYVAAFEASPPGPEAEAVAAQARVTLRGAAERAMALHAYDGAVGLYRQALTVTADGAERATLLERIADAAANGGGLDVAKVALQEAIDWYRDHDRRSDLVRATARLGALLLHEGSIADALQALEAAVDELGEDYPEDETFATLASELARAYWRNGEPARTLDWAERALVVGERLGLPKVIAETLDNKGGALIDLGRLQEGLALMRGAIRYAEARGAIEAELRARNNLVFMDADDPAGALEAGRIGLDRARRFGLRDWDRQLTQLLGRISLGTGDLDWVVAQTPVFEGPGVPPTYRAQHTSLRGVIAALRARPDEARTLLAEAAAIGRTVNDRQIGFVQTLDGAFVEALDGRPAEAHDRDLAAASAMMGTWSLYASLDSGFYALLLHDAPRLAAARTALLAVRHGRSGDALIAALDAALATLAGDVGAARRGFVEAADVVRAMGLRLDLSWILLGTVNALGPDDPVGRAAADEARALFETIGAPAFSALLDGIQAAGDRPAAAKPAARPVAVESPAAQA
ncbi:MAG: adenylate/guanylate cyclase domain-containing protein [Candidatus Limnocylindrales bacterium]